MGSPDIPTPPPPPVVPSEDPKVKAERLAAEKNALKAKGRSSTMLTGGSGLDAGKTQTTSRMLLGS